MRTLLGCLLALGATSVVWSAPAAADDRPAATCAGTVFVDLDADGDRREAPAHDLVADDLEPAIADAEVTITDRSGRTSVAHTDALGRWSTSLSADRYPIRLDFEIPDGLTDSVVGPMSATSMQFVTSPDACVSPLGTAGFVDPLRYCESDAPLIAVCHLRNDVGLLDEDRRERDDTNVELIASSTSDNRMTDPIVDDEWLDEEPVALADIERIGAVHGLATTRDGRIFASALVKRHTTLVSTLNPTGNPTAIFELGVDHDPRLFTIVDPTAKNPHRPGGRETDDDRAAMPAVFESGIGDIELSRDGSRLYAVDLGRRTLVEIDVTDGRVLDTTPIDGIRLGIEDCAVTARNPFGDLRPFGLGLGPDGELLVGVVCSAASTVGDDLPIDDTVAGATAAGDESLLVGHVFEFDKGRFRPRLRWPLAGYRGATSDGEILAHEAAWHPWVDEYPFVADHDVASYPQPAITDISVDRDGNLLLAIGDRWAHQTAPDSTIPSADGGREVVEIVAAGDIQHACPTADGWQIEGTGDCPGGIGDGWEFFSGDRYGWHAETALGALATAPGRRDMVATHFDPLSDDDTWQSGGLVWHDTVSGRRTEGLRLYDGRSARPLGTFEKGAGMGDIELLCGEAPIVIGGRIWHDANADAVADPAEEAIRNVPVELRDRNDRVVAETTTADDGRYQFDARRIAGGLDDGRAYTVTVADDAYVTGPFGAGGAWTGLRPLVPGDRSDGRIAVDVIAGDDPRSADVEPAIDHHADIAMIDQYDLAVFAALRQRGDDLDVIGLDVIVVNQGSIPSGSFVVSSRVPPGSRLVDAGDATIPATVDGDQVTWRIDAAHGLRPGSSIRLPIRVRVARRGDTEYVYTAQIVDAAGLDDDSVPGNALLDHPDTLRPADEVDRFNDQFAVAAWEDDSVSFSVLLRTMAGTIWHDTDRDGIRDRSIDAPEEPLEGVEIRLLRQDGTEFARTVTDADGWYEFPLIDIGTYRFEVAEESFDTGGPLESFDVIVGPDGALSMGPGYVTPPVTLERGTPVLVTDLGVANRPAGGLLDGNGPLLLGPGVLVATWGMLHRQRRRNRFGTGDLG